MTINIGANVRIHRLGVCFVCVILVLLYLYSIRESSYSQINKDEVSLRNLLAGAIRAAEIGGHEVIQVHDNPTYTVESKGKTKEGINDPVTAADYKSHCAMFHFLSSVFPGVVIISEEQSNSCDSMEPPDFAEAAKTLENYDTGYDVLVKASDVTVWIDPLDATKEFTENLLEYVTTMVCVAVKGVPIIGVVHKPFESKQTYWAWVDHGVSTNLQNNPTPKEPKTPILIVSRSHAGRVHNASKAAFGDNVKIISAAGAGYKSLELAADNATAYIHTTIIKKWDVCAGAAIITALGGTVSTLSGEPAIDFGPGDSTVLEHGLLETMDDHKCTFTSFFAVIATFWAARVAQWKRIEWLDLEEFDNDEDFLKFGVQARIKVAKQKLIEKQLTPQQRSKEKEMESETLQAVLKLLQERKDIFTPPTMTDLQEQLSLYRPR